MKCSVRPSLGKHGFALCIAFSACVAVAAAPMLSKSDATEVKDSFEQLRQALATGSTRSIAARLPPETMALFLNSRDLALNPDSTNINALSQFEMVLGYQAYWQIPRDRLRTMSAADMFEWGSQQGIVPMQGLASVQLTGIEVKGTAATAGIRHGGVLATNAVMPFVKTAGAWKLDLKKILLAPEPQFDALRAQRRLGKPELAVLLIENVHGQPISVLRELLLSPQVRRMVAALRGASPSNVCARVFTELSEGRQQDAEALLDVFAEVHTNDQRLAFIQATCSRSRFSINRADMQFEQVMAMNPTTVEGNAARYMLELDARRNVQDNMNGMRLLIGQNPDSPLLLWLMGIACQDNYKRTGETKLAKEGADSYRLLMKRFTVGPVLVHQTFANILAEQLALYEEALPHRELAVRLEPAAWTYQGLANTLTSLKRYDEADAAFRKVIEFDPDSAMFWAQWADSQSKADKYDSCIEKSRKAIELDPSYHRAYASLGFALQAQGKLEEALTAYKRAIAVNPAYGHAYAQAAAILTKLGRHEEAQDFLKRKKSIPGW